jgi:hypothetical protein
MGNAVGKQPLPAAVGQMRYGAFPFTERFPELKNQIEKNLKVLRKVNFVNSVKIVKIYKKIIDVENVQNCTKCSYEIVLAS